MKGAIRKEIQVLLKIETFKIIREEVLNDSNILGDRFVLEFKILRRPKNFTKPDL